MSSADEQREDSAPLDHTHFPDTKARPKALRPGETWRRRREQQEVEAYERQRKARVDGAIDWSTCLVPGCGVALRAYGSDDYERSSRRDSSKRLPLCVQHLMIVWQHVEIVKGHPAIIETNEMIRERKRLAEEVESQRLKVAHLARQDGHIYFIRLNGLVKVGWTRDIYQRVKSYGASADLLVHYPATRDDETTLHRQLRPALAKGREWYVDNDIIALFLEKALDEHGSPTVTVLWTEPKEVIKQRRRR